jgi:hypothetical protein
LSNENYHVLHFDLRIAGFADLASLYSSLSHQMEQYFEEIAESMPGYERFEKESWAFKVIRRFCSLLSSRTFSLLTIGFDSMTA